MKKSILKNHLFIPVLLAFIAGGEVQAQATKKRDVAGSSPTKKGTDSLVAINTASIRLMRSADKTLRSLELNESCIIDGTFYDECPFDFDEPGPGGVGGGPNPQTTPPDFNPISGSINVTNPAIPGADFQFQVIIANAGGIFFPPGSLVQAPDVVFDGVVVNFHILKPGNNQPNASNMVFQGIFDPEHAEQGSDYLLTGHFPLPASKVTPGANHQFVVVVDPDNFMPELNEGNNVSFDPDILKVLENKPDFVPLTGATNVKLLPNPVTAGESFTVGCKVQNKGAAYSDGPLAVKYTAVLLGGDELANPIVLGTSSQVFSTTNPLGTNAKTSVISRNVTINMAPGQYRISALVDPQGVIPETSTGGETNNTAVLGTITILAAPGSPPKPDLRFEAIADPVLPPVITQDNHMGIFKINLRNGGAPLPVDSISIMLICNSPGRLYSSIVKFKVLGHMGAGEVRTLVKKIDIYEPGLAPSFLANDFLEGFQQVEWEADFDNDIAELNEHNNEIKLNRAFELKARDLVLVDTMGVQTVIDSSAALIKTNFTVHLFNNGLDKLDKYKCRFTVQLRGGISIVSQVFESKPGSPNYTPVAGRTFVAFKFTLPGAYPATTFPLLKLKYELDTDNDLLEYYVKHAGEGNNTGIVPIAP